MGLLEDFKLIKRELEYKPLRMNLQYFAEEEQQDEQQEEVEKVELTADELQKKIESESDKKIAKALETAKSKWEKEFNEKLEQEKKEAERLAKLSEKERKEEELTKREQELQDRLRQLELKELKADAIADLNEKGLPSEFADFLLADNAEKTLENINHFKTAFDQAVNEAVKGKLRQETPKASGNNVTLSREQFNNMTYLEKVQLKQSNPEQYNTFIKGE